YVADLEASARFYTDALGFEVIYSEDRMKALGVAGRQVLLLFREGASAQTMVTPSGTFPPHDATGQIHLAFGIPPDAVEAWRARLANLGIPLESTIRLSDRSTGLYFRDPDGHLIELISPGAWKVY
ncbi:MAG TPA: VOC family protein, partial [Bryobacteraceae bacterium]|nr:VOC family protein [Bryobacteraceae bacterium]